MSRRTAAAIAIMFMTLGFTRCDGQDPLTLPGQPTASKSQPGSLYSRVLRSTALVITPTAQGTAWVVDHDRKLLITNYHVACNFEEDRLNDSVILVFPKFQDGVLVPEKKYYEDNLNQLLAAGDAVSARVVDAVESIDLALLVAQSLPPEATALPLGNSASPGDTIHSVGNPAHSDSLWHYSHGSVNQISKRSWFASVGSTLQQIHAKVIETQVPSNPGASGGPVVNDTGALVGVTQGAITNATLLNLAIDVSEVKAYLDASQWLVNPGSAAEFHRRADHYFSEAEVRRPRHDRPQLAISDIDVAIKSESEVADHFATRARILTRLGFLDSTFQEWMHLQYLGGLKGNTIEQMNETRGRQYSVIPREFFAALADCDRALELDPRSAITYVYRARIVNICSGLPRNLTRLPAGEDFFPDKPFESKLLRKPHTEGIFDAGSAIADCRRAIEIDPDCQEAYWQLDLMCDADESITRLSELLQRQPRNVRALIARAKRYSTKENYEAAVADLTVAISEEPDNGQHYRQRGFVFAEADQIGKAVNDHAEAVRLSHGDPDCLETLAEALVRQGDFMGAVSAYTQMLQTAMQLGFPDYRLCDILVARGDAYAAAKSPSNASADYEMALSQGGLLDSAKKAVLEKLKSLPE